jgi:hypothetical protein
MAETLGSSNVPQPGRGEIPSSPESSPESLADGILRPPGRSYRRRFRMAYIALAVVFWVVVAGVAVSVTGGISRDKGPIWSSWKPNQPGIDGAKEIATFVAAKYHLSNGGPQLVAVQANKPEIQQNVPLELIAVRGGGGANDVIATASAKNSIVYLLCGLGAGCAITTGTPTEARARLLRREALELALYTFKYVKGVDSVITFLPPPPNQKPPSWSVYFRKSEFKQELKQPLRKTLPAVTTPTPDTLKPDESDTIERLTRDRWFKSEFQPLQDGSAVLVLDPITTTG